MFTPLLFSLAPSIGSTPALNVGDPAPPVTVSSWLKQNPGEFNNKVYVIEFWATWCGPCKESIPHLTELSHQYKGRVQFVGIDSSEQDWNAPAKFVSEMGDKMDYSVGVDRDGTMAKTWLAAAGENTIPTAFIVEYGGRIAWIGHPRNMETPLEAIAAGTPNITERFRQERLVQQARDAERKELMDEYAKQCKAKDWDGAAATLDTLERGGLDVSDIRAGLFQSSQDAVWLGRYTSALAAKTGAALESYSDFTTAENAVASIQTLDQVERSLHEATVDAQLERLKVYFKTGDKRFPAYAQSLVSGPERNNPKVLNRVAWLIAGPDPKINSQLEKITIAKFANADVPAGYTNPPTWPAGTIDRNALLPLANAAATKAVTLTGRKDSNYLDTLAWVRFQMGRRQEASLLQKESAARAPDNSWARLSSEAISKWMVRA